jgi:hypothetical protein
MTDYGPHSSEELPHIYQKGSEQYNFVKNDLARSAINPDWIIVSHHKGKCTFNGRRMAGGISSTIREI